MKSKIIGLLFMAVAAYADENPFNAEQNVSIITPPPFQRGDVKFNSSARILKSISFHYINLDGTEDTLNLDINKSIDWHDTYTLTRSKSPEASKILDVSVTIPQGNSNNDANLSKDFELPSQTGKIDTLLTYTSYKDKMKINTNNELIADFSIGNPSKIVLDFKSEKIAPSKIIRIKDSLFKRIDFGSHNGYYRLVLYLDGKYHYKIEKDTSGYLINLS